MDLLHGGRRKQLSSKSRKLRSMPSVAILQAALLLLLLPLAGAAAQHSSSGARPNCATTCGDVPVPYPFGVGAGCYSSPGFNLTCDTTRDPPRLLLGPDAAFQVLNISLANATVRAARTGGVNFTTFSSVDGRGAWRGLGDDARASYALSDDGNELVVVRGCDVLAQLSARAGSNVTINGAGSSGNSTISGEGGSGNVTICGCATFSPGTGAGRTSLAVIGGRCTTCSSGGSTRRSRCRRTTPGRRWCSSRSKGGFNRKPPTPGPSRSLSTSTRRPCPCCSPGPSPPPRSAKTGRGLTTRCARRTPHAARARAATAPAGSSPR